MIIQLDKEIEKTSRAAIESLVAEYKIKTTSVKTQVGEYIVCIGGKQIDIRRIGSLPGVSDLHIVSDAYKLVSRKWKVNPTVIDLGDEITIEEGKVAIMTGPCSIEGEEQIAKTIEHMKQTGVKIMRGGVYKPRSSPYAFRGLGIEGLKLWHTLAKEAGIKIITEVMQVSQIEEMLDYVDIFQVGARNTQNFNLLDELGRVDKPVLIKRGISGTIDELLQSAEYVFSAGNEKLMLCERGIRTFETASRNTMDLNAIAILKEKSHLPVIADPSHGIGIRDHVAPIAMASILAGADGVIFESHEKPEEAYSDGQQTLDFNQSAKLIENMRKVAALREEL